MASALLEIIRATLSARRQVDMGRRRMVDKFDDPLLTPREAARHLLIPRATMYYWLHEQADGAPLVHRVTPEKRGWPSMPFVAVVEAYVLRSLRELGLRKNVIRDAAARVRREFDTPYGLATKRIATDGIDIFVQYADDDLARAGDNQLPIRHDARTGRSHLPDRACRLSSSSTEDWDAG